MMKIVVALLGLLTGTRAASFSCEGSLKTVTNDVIKLPCSIEIKFLRKEFKQEFWLEMKECAKEFRVYGSTNLGNFDEIVTEEHNEVKFPGIGKIPGGCTAIKFNSISTSEDGISFCPTFDCRFVKDPPCVSVSIDDSCMSKQSCGDCITTPGCGWCYDNEQCLPKAASTDIDRCKYCEDWTSTECPACPENCGGHGDCTLRSCKCNDNWTGTGTCNVYQKPTSKPCPNMLGTVREPIAFSPSSYAGGLYHSMLSVSSVAYFAVETNMPQYDIFVRVHDRASVKQHDYRSSKNSLGGAPCVSHDNSVVISLTDPSFPAGAVVWIGVHAPLGTDGMKVTVTLGTCSAGFSGWPCVIPVTDLLVIEDEDTRGKSHTYLETRTVGVMKGEQHLMRFRVPSETVKIVPQVPDSIAKYVTTDLLLEGKKIDGSRPPPTDDAGVLITVNSNLASDWLEVPLTIGFTVCETTNYESECEGLMPHLLVAGQPSVSVEWPKHSKWTVVQFTVPSGVGRVIITGQTSAASPRLVADFRVRPTERSQWQAHNMHLELDHPSAGHWFVGMYTPVGTQVDESANFMLEMSDCAECGAAYCNKTFGSVAQRVCSPTDCLSPSQSSSVDLAQCSNTMVVTTPSPSAETVLMDDGGADTNTMVGIIVGAFLGVCLVATGIAVAYMYSRWRVKKDQERREQGGYDFAPTAVPGDEMQMSDTGSDLEACCEPAPTPDPAAAKSINNENVAQVDQE